VHDRDLPPERDLRGDRRSHPAAVDHDRGRVEVDQQPVEPGHQHCADRGRMGFDRFLGELRDVGRHSECLEGLVHGHRVGAGGDGERADPVGFGEGRGHWGQPGHLRSTAGDQEHIVVVVLVGQGRFELGHARIPLTAGGAGLASPPV
jgi:hypothetical protein